MSVIKCLVKYTDWLLYFSGRNALKPEVGDVILSGKETFKVRIDDISSFNEWCNEYYVEIDSNTFIKPIHNGKTKKEVLDENIKKYISPNTDEIYEAAIKAMEEYSKNELSILAEKLNNIYKTDLDNLQLKAEIFIVNLIQEVVNLCVEKAELELRDYTLSKEQPSTYNLGAEIQADTNYEYYGVDKNSILKVIDIMFKKYSVKEI